MNQKTICGGIIPMLVLVAAMVSHVYSQPKNNAEQVTMELIGQVTNPSPATSIQIGYLTYANGLESELFTGVPNNETNALLTFFSDTVTTRVINNGTIRTINRRGTFMIYLDTTPNGDFADPDTFRDGSPVLTADLRHQVIVDTITSAFTATFTLTVTSVEGFEIGSQYTRLGRVGQKLRLTFFGHLNSPGPPSGYISGMMIGS